MESKLEQPLRVVSPKLYDKLITELEKLHIHPYDYQATVVEKENGLEVILRFGEGFIQSETQLTTYQAIEKGSPEINDFIKTVGESCKKALIADYFKMMKP
jgi:hypothetical protein